ncbi:MAG: sensor histidine kinase [Pontibacterium sp.]
MTNKTLPRDKQITEQTLDEKEIKIAELEAEVKRLQAELTAQKDAHIGVEEVLLDRMRQILDILPAGVILIGADGVIFDTNPAGEELLGLPLKGEPWLAIIQRSFAPRSDDGHEVSLKDGRRVSLATRAISGEGGQLVLVNNLTETRLLQERLSHYQRLSEMGRMMASLAHQIRTPLAAALLYTGHLSRPDLSVDQRIRFTSKVKQRLSYLERQVRDMLVFARGETHLADEITAEHLLGELEDQLDLPLVEYDADCDFIDNTQGSAFVCNKDALVGAIMNLVENSLQAAGQQAHLKVMVTQVEQMLAVSVQDNGPGMSEEACRRASEPFYTTKARGTGLGLAVAQVVAISHKGRFEIHSQSGVGTLAAINFPINLKPTQLAEGTVK